MFGLLLIVVIVTFFGLRSVVNEMNVTPQCDLHKWHYDNENIMRCSKCGIKPGDNF